MTQGQVTANFKLCTVVLVADALKSERMRKKVKLILLSPSITVFDAFYDAFSNLTFEHLSRSFAELLMPKPQSFDWN